MMASVPVRADDHVAGEHTGELAEEQRCSLVEAVDLTATLEETA